MKTNAAHWFSTLRVSNKKGGGATVGASQWQGCLVLIIDNLFIIFL